MTEQWTNQREIKSSSSSRLYVVAERLQDGQPTGLWGCSCPQGKLAIKKQKACKHLITMGLPPYLGRPWSRSTVATSSKADTRHAFSDAAYAHYDTSNGFGTAEEWIRIAEGRAQGRGRYRPPPRTSPRWHTQDDDLRLLGLDAMPADAKGLVKAMRKMAMKLHPDHGGDRWAFQEMIMAYERLLKSF